MEKVNYDNEVWRRISCRFHWDSFFNPALPLRSESLVSFYSQHVCNRRRHLLEFQKRSALLNITFGHLQPVLPLFLFQGIDFAVSRKFCRKLKNTVK